MQKILSLLRRCVEDYDMIAPGERVAVGVSGGKDSLVLLAALARLALLLAAVSILLFLPILLTYLDTGLVPRFPTLIVSGFIMVAALQSLFCGLLLDNMRQKDCRDFEFQLQQAHDSYRRMQERA